MIQARGAELGNSEHSVLLQEHVYTPVLVAKISAELRGVGVRSPRRRSSDPRRHSSDPRLAWG
jgi:hypothetical protein